MSLRSRPAVTRRNDSALVSARRTGTSALPFQRRASKPHRAILHDEKQGKNPESRAPSWVFYINQTLVDISNSINHSKCGVETHRSVVSIAHAHPWRVHLPLLRFHCSSRTACWYGNSACSIPQLGHVACPPGTAALHWRGFPCNCAHRAGSLRILSAF